MSKQVEIVSQSISRYESIHTCTCSLLSKVIIFSLKSTPIVASVGVVGNLPLQNLYVKQVLPTPESPMTMILNVFFFRDEMGTCSFFGVGTFCFSVCGMDSVLTSSLVLVSGILASDIVANVEFTFVG